LVSEEIKFCYNDDIKKIKGNKWVKIFLKTYKKK
jgi:hypothetical protein